MDLLGRVLEYLRNEIKAAKAATLPIIYPKLISKNNPPCELGATTKYIATINVKNVAGIDTNQ